jgi:hypothetical protein
MEQINNYTKEYGQYSGTEGFSYYLYGLIKMIKPDNIIELGTGYGVTAFMAAQACKENNNGKVVTIDDGSHYEKSFGYESFIRDKITKFNLEEYMEYKNITLDLEKFNQLDHIKNVDIIFNDIDCSPFYFISILKWLLPRLKEHTYFFIDRGATHWPSYCIIELVLNEFNKGKIPSILYDKDNSFLELESIVNKHKFFSHYVKKNIGNKKQDSFALVKIERNNISY